MAVSPADFRLWASATGNNYPNSAAERAALTPEVFNFAKNCNAKNKQQVYFKFI